MFHQGGHGTTVGVLRDNTTFISRATTLIGLAVSLPFFRRAISDFLRRGKTKSRKEVLNTSPGKTKGIRGEPRLGEVGSFFTEKGRRLNSWPLFTLENEQKMEAALSMLCETGSCFDDNILAATRKEEEEEVFIQIHEDEVY